jgi:hypothetical protein
MSYELIHLDENDQPITEIDAAPVLPTVFDSETPEYEITSGGASETWDPAKPGEGPTMDPMSLAKLRLQQLKAARRIMKKQSRAVQLGQHHVKKVAKGRRKKQLEKASRKRNR